MNRRDEIVAEFSQRTELLPRELEEWQERTRQNAAGMGIHHKQIESITLMFEGMIDTHRQLLGDVRAARDVEELANGRLDLEAELAGAHALMDIFRTMLGQRLESHRYRPVLDLADLVAADCYRPCVARVETWGKLEPGRFREPPLTYLNSQPSPAAYTRRHRFGILGPGLKAQEADLVLPIGVISLRYHDTAAVWSLCSLYHEAGHLLDQDLGLRPELAALIDDALPASAGDERRQRWTRRWSGEIVADALGVLLGGAGFAYSLADMLLVPRAQALQAGIDDLSHPIPAVRLSLLAALLRQAGPAGLADSAGSLEAAWHEAYGALPPELSAYAGDSCVVAEVLLDGQVAALGYRGLRALMEDRPGEHVLAAELAGYLLTGNDAPDAATFPYRPVPAAARLALNGVEGDLAAAYAGIQDRLLRFVADMDRPTFMAAESLEVEQRDYVRDLARKLRFA